MAINNLTSKLSRFCEAGSMPGIEGLSLSFHEAGHGLHAMERGADAVLDATPEIKAAALKAPKL